MEAHLSGLRRRLRKGYGHQLGASGNHRRIAVPRDEELSTLAVGTISDDETTPGISAALQHSRGQPANAGVLARNKMIRSRCDASGATLIWLELPQTKFLRAARARGATPAGA